MMGTMGQVPVLSYLAKGVILDLLAQMSHVPDGRSVIRIQLPGYDPFRTTRTGSV